MSRRMPRIRLELTLTEATIVARLLRELQENSGPDIAVDSALGKVNTGLTNAREQARTSARSGERNGR